MSQDLSGLTANQPYTLIFDINTRVCCGTEASEYQALFADATLIDEQIMPIDPAGNYADPYTTKYIVFTNTVTDGTLKFINVTATGDHTILLDNVRLAKGVVQPPAPNLTLQVSVVQGSLQITWPTTPASVLESTSALPGGWTASTQSVSVQGSQNMVIVSPSGKAQFFRLRQQ